MGDTSTQNTKRRRLEWLGWVILFATCAVVGAWLARPAPTPPPQEVTAAAQEQERASAPPQDRLGQPVRVGMLVGQVQDAAGQPLAGATLTATRLGRLEAGAQRSFTTQTDAQGRYRLGPLRVLGHQLQVEAEGFVSQMAPRLLPGAEPQTWVLASGDGMAGAVSWQGQPSVGARVTIAGAGLWPAVHAQTDAQGIFRSPSLEPGHYQVLVQQTQPRPLAVLAHVEHRAEQDQPFALELEPAASVRLQILGEGEETPLQGALMTLAQDEVHLLALSAWSDPQGLASLDAVPPGSYHLRVRAHGHETHRQTIQVELAGLEDRLALSPAARLQGLVTDLRGDPLELVRVRAHVLTPEGQQWILERDLTAKISPRAASGGSLAPSFATSFGFFSDAEGRFEVSGLPAGRVLLELQRDGLAPALVGPLTVRRGERRELPPVQLEPGYRLEGRVEGTEGNPLEGAQIWARPSGAPSLQQGSLPGMESLRDRNTATGESGRFALRDLPAQVTLSALAPGYRETSVTLDLSERAREPLALVLEPAGELRRGVVSQEGQSPVPEATLQHLPAPGQPARRGDACSARSDDHGRFTLAECPKEAFWVLVTPPEDSHAASAALQIQPGNAELQLDLPASGELLVRALDEQRQPLEAVEITALLAPSALQDQPRWLRSSYQRTWSTDARGEAKLTGLRQGAWTLQARRKGHQSQESAVQIGPELELAEVVLASVLRAPGAVTDRTGTPLEGARVRAWMPSEDPKQRLMELSSDNKGGFDLEMTRPGQLTVRAVHPEYGSGQVSLQVEASLRREDLVITLNQPTVDLDRWGDTLEDLGLTLWLDRQRVVLEEVDDDSAAARAGLQRRDLLLDMRRLGKGWEVDLLRGEQEIRLQVKP